MDDVGAKLVKQTNQLERRLLGANVIHPRYEDQLFVPGKPSVVTSARQLQLSRCGTAFARYCNAQWHSRLPHTQRSPWQYAFKLHCDGYAFGVALLHNPSARTLPSHWVELRRLALAPDAPRYAATRFLGLLVRWLKRNVPERERIISYQDTSVHTGTIYKAAGWVPAYTSRPRVRDRSKPRAGSARMYRTNANGAAVDSAAKIRWEKEFQTQQRGVI